MWSKVGNTQSGSNPAWRSETTGKLYKMETPGPTQTLCINIRAQGVCFSMRPSGDFGHCQMETTSMCLTYRGQNRQK